MGFFNAMSSIGKINNLLKDLENEVTITQSLVSQDASREVLLNHVNILSSIHQELINTFSNSSGARTAMFKIFGNKMQMHDILTYSKNLVLHLNAIAQNQQY